MKRIIFTLCFVVGAFFCLTVGQVAANEIPQDSTYVYWVYSDPQQGTWSEESSPLQGAVFQKAIIWNG